jgi:hypothetical protein
LCGEIISERGVGIRFEQQSQAGQEQALRGTEEAEITHLDEASGQNVLEEAVNELIGREGAELVLAGSGRAVAKGDLVVFELDQTVVADGDPEDVRSEILEGSPAIADWFAVDHPVLLPNAGWYIVGKVGSLKSVKEFSPEDPGKGFDREQEVVMGR